LPLVRRRAAGGAEVAARVTVTFIPFPGGIMKIKVVQKGTKKILSNHICPWFVDEPPAAQK
jgi:hypothetical protein